MKAYNKVLKKGKSNKCQNVGIRINPELKTMTTYNINKTGLTPIYTKRQVLEDGRISVPLLNVDLEANLDDHDIDEKKIDFPKIEIPIVNKIKLDLQPKMIANKIKIDLKPKVTVNKRQIVLKKKEIESKEEESKPQELVRYHG